MTFTRIFSPFLVALLLIISSCSSNIYNKFDRPILVKNILEVNDSIVKKNPVNLLIQPSPINKFLSYPLGLAINNLANDNPDEKFRKWLEKNENRSNRLEKLISNKGVAKPTIMTAVPRFYQNLFTKINMNFEKQSGLKRKLINQTLNLGKKLIKKEELK